MSQPDGRLAALRLAPGEQVRFRRVDRSRPQHGVVVGVEADGSVGLTDAEGRHRSVPVARIEVRLAGAAGRRAGSAAWEPLADRIARPEQLDLLGA